MDVAEFDKFADEYEMLHRENIGVTGERPTYFAEYKIRDIANQMRTNGCFNKDLRILDFGSGVGSSIPFYVKYFPSCEIVCVDVSLRSLEIAKDRFGRLASYLLFSGETLPLRSSTFDIVFAACVFHHIPGAEHLALLREMRRVLATEAGWLFLYEHNPMNPLTRRAVNTCVFDREAVLIPPWQMYRGMREAGYTDISVYYRVFFPRVFALFRFLEYRLSWLPLGAQYCVAGAASHRARPRAFLAGVSS